MTTVARLPTGDYIMTYEYGGGPVLGNTTSYTFPVYYRISADPLDFNSSEGIPLVPANTGTIPVSSPYVVHSSVGGENGTIVVSSGSQTSIFTNQALGAEGEWYEWSTAQPSAYSRHLRVFGEDHSKLIILGAGHLPPSTTNNVSLSVLDLTVTLGL